MIEKTKQLVESKYTVSNGYQADCKVRVALHPPPYVSLSAAHPSYAKLLRRCVFKMVSSQSAAILFANNIS